MNNHSYGYYGFDIRGREFIYVPGNLIGITGICSKGDFNFDYRPDTLSMISSLFSRKAIIYDDLLKEGWEICRIDLPRYFLRGFQDLCFKLETQENNSHLIIAINEKAREIVDYSRDFASFDPGFSSEVPDKRRETHDNTSHGEREIFFEGGYHENIPEDDEDISDDWWIRGEDPPI